MTDHSIRISTLDENITVYDLEGKIIKQIPDLNENAPKVTYFNILEYEDRIMGVDSNAKPDFFIDFENDERFMELFDDLGKDTPELLDKFFIIVSVCILVLIFTGFILGFILTGI